MRILNKFLGLLTIFSLTFSIPFHATAAEDKESFFPASLQQSDPQRVFSLGDDTELGFSQLGKWPDKLCTSTADPNCDFNDAKWGVKTIMATALLNVCTSQENEDCIESVEIARDGKEFSALKFEKYVVGGTCDATASAGCAFPPDPSKNLPRGGRLSIWSEVVDGKTLPIKYLMTYSYEMNYDDESKYFVINNVGLAIRPMKEIDANDLSDSRALTAVTLNSIRSKSDKDLRNWLPAVGKCGYIKDWVTIKKRYSLTYDNLEMGVVRKYSGSCKLATIKTTALSGYRYQPKN